MSRFDDIVAAYGRREHAGHLLDHEHEQCATKLYDRIRTLAFIPDGARIRPAPIDEEKGGLWFGFMDHWYHLRFLFEFVSPNTSLQRGINVRLRLRKEHDGRWAIRFYQDDKSRYFDPTSQESIDGICEDLFQAIITWLDFRPSYDLGERLTDLPQIGFHGEQDTGPIGDASA